MRQPRKRSRIIRYSLRSFLLLFTLVALWFAWLAAVGNQQRRVLHTVEEYGGSVVFKYQEGTNLYLDAEAPIRDWLASNIGDEFVFSIAGVYLEGTEVDDDAVRRIIPLLEKLRHLKWVEFRGTNITDESMGQICRLGSVERLFIRPKHEGGMFYKSPVPIQITDTGLSSIANLSNLKVLSLNYGTISGEGFESLHSISTLEELDFRGPPDTPQHLAPGREPVVVHHSL